MPYGFGHLGGGVHCAPSMLDVLQSYLTARATTGNADWQPSFEIESNGAVPNLPVLAPPGDVDSVPWSGTLLQTAGRTGLMEVQALYLAGSGPVTTSFTPTPGDSGNGGNLQSPISYYPSDNAPIVLSPCWIGVPRLDGTDWRSETVANEAWCALPCSIAAGSWASADGLGPPYDAQVAGESGWVELPALWVLMGAMGPGKVGAPDLWVPLTWTTRHSSSGPYDLTDVWAQLRGQVSASLDALEQGDMDVYRLLATDGVTVFRQGPAQERFPGLGVAHR